MRDLRAIGRRFFRGTAFTALLKGCGIEPHQYWILVDLFQTLSKRQEVVRMGSHNRSLRFITITWFIISSIISLLMAAGGASSGVYLLVFVGLTVFQLSFLLIPEVAENLVNPVEGLILAHQPVNGSTWSGAKLTHLIKVVVYVVMGVNGVPALVGVFLPHNDVVYLPMHFVIVLGVGLVVALLCCSLFGWLVRFIPVRRLKAAAAMAQVLPMFFMFGYNFLNLSKKKFVKWVASIEPPEAWLAVGDAVPGGFPAVLSAVGIAIAVFAFVFGLRALSGDHLIRVSGLMHSGSIVRRRERRQWKVGPWIARFASGQASRAGFEYLCSMMLRDWQFRRNMMVTSIPIVFFGFIIIFRSGWGDSPFDPGFAFMHFLPHLFGLMIVFTCTFLAYGNDYKGIWSLSIVPDSSLRPFVRGIYALLWFMLAVVPNVVCLFVLVWSWGVGDAVLFIAYSTVVAFLYLGVGLKMIDGVPFGKQSSPDQNADMIGIMLIYLVAVGIAIGIQYVLFRWFVAVVVLTLAVGLGTYFLTRDTLAGFESRIRFQLNSSHRD